MNVMVDGDESTITRYTFPHSARKFPSLCESGTWERQCGFVLYLLQSEARLDARHTWYLREVVDDEALERLHVAHDDAQQVTSRGISCLFALVCQAV
jgi:hypothetical protein